MTDFPVYCPRCGGSLASQEVAEQTIPVCQACAFQWWPAMYPAVSVGIFNEAGEVLVITRGNEPQWGMLDWPGGFVQYRELPEAAAVREVTEELGVEVAVGELIGFGVDTYRYQGITQYNLNIGYMARVVSGEVRAADPGEVAALEWQRPADIPLEAVAFEGTREFIRLLAQKPGSAV